jgi:hypothetical protein
MYKRIRLRACVQRQYRAVEVPFLHLSGACASIAPDQQHTMRLIARFVVLMVAVFGVSLAFAWAWDKSDSPQASAQAVHGS